MDDETMFSLFDSLKREMEEMRQELRPIRDSVQRIEARISRQSGLLQGGTRQLARLATWSEDVDEMLAERDKRIEDLTRRVEKLEKGPPGAN